MSPSNRFLSRLPFTKSLHGSRVPARSDTFATLRQVSISGHDAQINFWLIVVLLSVHTFGVYSVFGLAYRSGYYDELIRIRDEAPRHLPGSDLPVLTRYTGIPFTDMMLALANVLFAHVTDGSAPLLSIYGFQFAGQLVPVFVTFMIEGIRTGHCKTAGVHLASFYTLVWGCFFQSPGYAFVMPLYTIANLLTSPTAQRVDENVAQDLRPYVPVYLETIIPSMIIAYVIPTILMCWPFQSSTLHQIFNAIWQIFPIWVLLTQYGLVLYKKEPVSTSKQLKDPRCRAGEQGTEACLLPPTGLSAAMHLAPIVLILTAKAVPSILRSIGLESLTFYDVFVPTAPWSDVPMESMALTMKTFFQYDQYVGSAAALVWAVALHIRSRTGPLTLSHFVWLVAEMMLVSIICGPGASLMLLLWTRDEQVLSDDNLFLKQDSSISSMRSGIAAYVAS